MSKFLQLKNIILMFSNVLRRSNMILSGQLQYKRKMKNNSISWLTVHNIQNAGSRYLIVHLSGQILQLDPSMLQGVLFYMVRRCVGQQLVECDNVSRDLEIKIIGQKTSQVHTWCIGQVKNISRERPLQAGFFSNLDKRPANLKNNYLIPVRYFFL